MTCVIITSRHAEREASKHCICFNKSSGAVLSESLKLLTAFVLFMFIVKHVLL